MAQRLRNAGFVVLCALAAVVFPSTARGQQAPPPSSRFEPQLEVTPYYVGATGSDNFPAKGNPQINDVWMDYLLILPVNSRLNVSAKQFFQFDTVGRTYLPNGRPLEPGSARQAVDQFLVGYRVAPFAELHAGYYRKWTICCPADGAPGNKNTTDYSGPDYGLNLSDRLLKRLLLSYTIDDIWVKHRMYPRVLFGGLTGEGNKWVVRHGLFAVYSVDPRNKVNLEGGIGQQGDYYQDYPIPTYGLSITYGASYRFNKKVRLEVLGLHRNGHDDGLFTMHQTYRFSNVFVRLHLGVLGPAH